jgi:hypothetical protein
MHKFTAAAMTVTVTASALGLAASQALASSPASHGHNRSGHGPAMNISFTSGPGSSAHWLPRQQAVLFRVGADTGGPTQFAQIVVHHFPAAPSTAEPTFAVTGPGSPVLQIGFAGGGYLQCTGGGSTACTAYDPTGTALGPATDYVSALAAEQGSSASLTVDAVTLTDTQMPQGPAYADTITALLYNTTSLIPRGHKQGHHHG